MRGWCGIGGFVYQSIVATTADDEATGGDDGDGYDEGGGDNGDDFDGDARTGQIFLFSVLFSFLFLPSFFPLFVSSFLSFFFPLFFPFSLALSFFFFDHGHR